MLTVISVSTKIKLSIEDFNAMYNKIAENEKGSIKDINILYRGIRI